MEYLFESTKAGLLIDTLLVVAMVFCAGGVATYLLVPLIIRLSPRLGLVDMPGSNSVHRQPTSRAGGIAIFIGFHLATVLLLISPFRRFGVLDLWSWWYTLVLTSLVVFLVGLTDDVFRLTARWKLVGQLLAACIAYYADVRIESIFGIGMSEPLIFLATIFWFVLMTNAFNLIDGIDGLAGGLAALSALGLAGALIFRGIYIEAVILVGLIAALLGFLRYNSHPARIFLGDCGSNLCGFILAYVMITTGSKNLAFSQQWIVLLAFAVPIFDTGLAVWRRVLGLLLHRANSGVPRRGIFTGDLEHLHHKLLRMGLRPTDACAVLYLVSAVCILASLVSLPLSDFAPFIIGVVFLGVVSFVLSTVPFNELRESAQLLYELMKRERAPLVGFSSGVALDVILLFSALIASWTVCYFDDLAPSAAALFKELAASWSTFLIILVSLIVVWASRVLKRLACIGCGIFGVALLFVVAAPSVVALRIVPWYITAAAGFLYALLALLLILSKEIAKNSLCVYVERYKL